MVKKTSLNITGDRDNLNRHSYLDDVTHFRHNEEHIVFIVNDTSWHEDVTAQNSYVCDDVLQWIERCVGQHHGDCVSARALHTQARDGIPN